MKIKYLLGFLLSSIFCLEPNKLGMGITFITFWKNEVTIIGEGAVAEGTEVSLEKPGTYLIQGSSDEANIIVKESSIILYLENLEISSSKTAPITINSNLKEIKLINVQNSILNDYEDSSTTKGECAVIKIKKNSELIIENQNFFYLNGYCKNIIKGGDQVSIKFENSNGEYIINANKTAIATDGYLEFNGGKFTIDAMGGDAIKCSPDETDKTNLGKILINDGHFNIECYNDAFTATNNIEIVKGVFTIKTENGYDSKTFNSSEESAKGFKVTNNETGSEIVINDGDFDLNTADDAFHSNGDLKLLAGKYKLSSGDDGLHAGLNLVLGKKDEPNDKLNVNILHSYEAIEGMTITIYSGRINVTAEDDGINGAGGEGGDMPPGPGPGPRPGPWNETEKNLRKDSSDDDPEPEPEPGPGPRPGPGPFPPGGRGNASYFISIHGGEIYVFCDGDGLDTNGNIFIHGGDINVFSQGNRDNEPIDHDGNFTLFEGTVLGVGSQGMEKIHEGIMKGNEMYAYYDSDITKNKQLKIKDENNNVVKEGTITKDINYIFYSSLKLNEDYTFYIYDENEVETKLNFTFGRPQAGEDDEENKHDDVPNSQKYLQKKILGIALLLIFL